MQGKQKEREEEGPPDEKQKAVTYTHAPLCHHAFGSLADEMPLTGTRPAALGTVAVA